MQNTRWWTVAVLAVVLVACGGDDDEAGGGGSDVCGALEEISELDDGFEAELDELIAPVLEAGESGDQQAIQEAGDAMAAGMTEVLDRYGDPLLDAYTRLEPLVPDDLADDLVVVRDFTADVLAQLAAAEPTLEGIEAIFESVNTEQGQAAGSATVALDEYSTEECDVSIAD